jgi:CYTH domain-containing protein
MGNEVERKFVLSEPPPGLESQPRKRIEQGYLAIGEDGVEVRIRRADGECTLTVKSAPGLVRVEEELEIDERRFEALWQLTPGRRVVKTRYLVGLDDDLTAEVDDYANELEGLMTAEVEFPSEEASASFEPDDWMGREVTGDERYANRSLAVRGTPHMRFPSFVDALPVTRDALAYAAELHTGQRRSGDQAPFILHPLEVAQLLRGRDYPDEIIAAGVLHDVIEDTGVSLDELTTRFGVRVAELVGAVTEPSSEGPYRERKARLRDSVAHAQPDAVAIYAADKVAKVRELRLVIAATADYEADQEQLDHYWASLELLEGRDAAMPLVRQLRFELEALAMLPPA